ncbi:MAG: hypothetical protein ACR2PC_05425 [Tsuneonella suprasediminis]|nr:hypothetical protein LBX01_14550 [Altererythrobacter sp. N1]
MMRQIEARAIRRCGELLKQFDGRGRPSENSEGALNNLSQREAAEQAGYVATPANHRRPLSLQQAFTSIEMEFHLIATLIVATNLTLNQTYNIARRMVRAGYWVPYREPFVFFHIRQSRISNKF